MKQIYLTLLLVVGLTNITQAQQDALFSQYMFNHFAVNPAYAGSREAISLNIDHRAQWVGIDGAPTTTSFGIHSPIRDKNLALGFNVYNDIIGPTSNQGAYGTIAYHLPMPKGHLSFGMRAGLINSTFDFNKLNYQTIESSSSIGSIQEGGASFDAGLYYYTNHFYVGLSSSHLGGDNFDHSLTDTTNITLSFQNHNFISAGAALKVNKDIVLKPSFLVKYVTGAPINIDLNMSVLLKKVLWFGVSYRHQNAVSIVTEYNVTDFMRIGYSYDIVTNNLKRFNNGSHEIFLGLDFSFKRENRVVSPRYL